METVENYFLNERLPFNYKKPKFHKSNKEKCGKAALKFRVHGWARHSASVALQTISNAAAA